jgi:Tfp pilus assembly protein PilN
VRPVNLIPPDQRKGAARGTGADATPVGLYALFGALGVALLCVLALVLTNNGVNSKTEELSEVKVQAEGAKQVADALRPYGTFAQMQQARNLEIATLVSNRFNWERALRQLSHVIPENVWLLGLSGTLSPEIDVEDSGGGGDVTNLRQKAKAPAFAMTGCTYSQPAVARMMTRMRNLDDVTDVQLARSAKKDQAETGGGTAVTQTDSNAATEDVQDCIGDDNITKFELLIVFGGAPTASPETAGAAGNPSSAAQAIGAAQGAVATAQSGSAQSGAAPAPAGGTP